MPLQYLHPHLQTSIVDNSQHRPPTEQLHDTALFAPIFADRGIDNEIILFTSNRQFLNEMGEPNFWKYGQAQYNVHNFLRDAGYAYVIRLLPDQASHAHANVVARFLTEDGTNNTITPGPSPSQTPGASSLVYVQFGPNWNPDKVRFPNLIGMENLQPDMDNLQFPDGATKSIFPAIVAEHPIPTALMHTKNVIIANHGEDDGNVHLFTLYSKGRGNYGNNFSFTMEIAGALEGSFPFTVYMLRFFERQENGHNRLIEGPYQVTLYQGARSLMGTSMFIGNVLERFSHNFGVAVNLNNINHAFDLAMNLPENEGKSRQEIDILDINGHSTKVRMVNQYGDPAVDEDGNPIFAQNFLQGNLTRGTDTGLTAGGTIPTLAEDVISPAERESLLIRAFSSDEDDADRVIDRDILNKRVFPIDVILDANYPMLVKHAIAQFTEARTDVFAFLDLGLGLRSGQDMIDAARLLRIPRSPHNAILGPSIVIYDEFTNSDIEVTLTYDIAGRIAEHDAQFGKQMPLAGYTRGVIEDYKSISLNPLRFEREKLYQARINYIETDYRSSRYMTNLTSQTAHTALSNINNVRVLGTMIRNVEQIAENYFFEHASPETLGSFQSDINHYMSQWTNNGACTVAEAEVFQDPYDAEQKIVQVRLSVEFTHIIERINIVFNVN